MKKISLVISALLIGLFYFHSSAQQAHSIDKEIQDAFTARADTVEGHIIQYRETLICPEASDSAVLVLFLHSAGGRGDDNLSQLGMRAIKDIYEYLRQHDVHAYFIAPQCPQTASWNGSAPGGDRPRGNGSSSHRPIFDDRKTKLDDATPYVKYLMPFLKRYVAAHPISNSKIFVLGASMGAAGVWELLAEYPRFFAAAMPVSGSYRGKDLAPFIQTSVVCVTGTEENSFENNKRMIDRLRAAGGDATFISLEGMRHVDACDRAFSVQNLDQLFSKHR